MDADPGMAEINPARLLLGAEALRKGVDLERGGDRPVGVIGLLLRRAEEREHTVTGELVDKTTLLENRRAHAFEILIGQICQKYWIKTFRERREPGNVAEQHRNLPPLAAELRQCFRVRASGR